MRIGVYGGSFDPFHNGHLALIKSAWETGKLDKILVIPVGTAPHKSHRMSLAAYRYEMARLGTTGLNYVELLDDEIASKGVDYTLETVRHLRRVYARKAKSLKFDLIVGSDVLFTFETWHKPKELSAEVRLLVALRGNQNEQEAKEKAEALRAAFGTKIKFFYMPPIELSSTLLREALAAEKDVSQLVPDAVHQFIKSNRIYEFGKDIAAIDDETWHRLLELEIEIWPLMPQKRRVHTLNVMLYAVRLARLHGLDVAQAAIAGLVHDCAKHLPMKLQMKYAKRAGNIAILNDEVAHGPAGSYYARKKLGITDRDVLAAIFYHTTSRGLMTPLDQVIYLADKIEYGRPFKDLEPIRKAAKKDLDLAMELCINEVFKALSRSKKEVHPFTKAAKLTLTHFKPQK